MVMLCGTLEANSNNKPGKTTMILILLGSSINLASKSVAIASTEYTKMNTDEVLLIEEPRRIYSSS
jgi:hypothetical protein